MPERLNRQTKCYARKKKKKAANLVLGVVLFPLEVPQWETKKVISIILVHHVIKRLFCLPQCSCGLQGQAELGSASFPFWCPSLPEVFCFCFPFLWSVVTPLFCDLCKHGGSFRTCRGRELPFVSPQSSQDKNPERQHSPKQLLEPPNAQA